MARTSDLPGGLFISLWRDKWLLAASFVLLWHARITTRLLGFGDPRERCLRTVAKPPASPALARRVALSVERASTMVAEPTCLTKAIAGQRLLALKGFGSQIRVGVRKAGTSQFEAHAWLMSGGLTVLGGTPDELAGFQVLIGSG